VVVSPLALASLGLAPLGLAPPLAPALVVVREPPKEAARSFRAESG
jgi:hypothetical protein